MAVIHVLPADDLIEHDWSVESGQDCLCGPSIEPVFRKDGSCGWLVTHHSLDGRETGESDSRV
jgi:hypothetical protein